MIKFLDLQKVTQKYSKEIHEAVSRVIDSGWYLQGKENETFEKEYSQYIGTQYTIGVANGLDALIWIYRAYIEIGVMKPGDEVIVPANTYIATILALTENGLVPVLVEPNYQTLEIDDNLIEKAITKRTKSIFIVHQKHKFVAYKGTKVETFFAFTLIPANIYNILVDYMSLKIHSYDFSNSSL